MKSDELTQCRQQQRRKVGFLEPEGMFVIEAHYLGDLVGQNAFDTIYHEHVSYWALAPLERLLARHSLEVFDVERLPIHHGQMRVWIGRGGARAVDAAVGRWRESEARAGLGRLSTFIDFSRRVQTLRAGIGNQPPSRMGTLLSFATVTARAATSSGARGCLARSRMIVPSGL